MSSSLSPGAVKVVAVSTVFTFFAVLFVGLRLVARFGFTKVGRRDEIAIVASLICSLGVLAATIREAKYGLGKPSPTLSLEDKEEFLKSLFVAICFYNISLALTKFAIVLQYMRVFTTGRIRYYCWISMALVIGFGIESLGISIFACSPVPAFWDLTITNAHCVDKKFLWFFNASFSIFTDIVLLALPIPVLLKLVIPKNQKILLMGIFALGGFACLVSILRLQSLYAASTADDLILKNINSGMWSAIEINTGIICASLQTIRPVVARVFPNLFTSTSHRGYERTIDTGSRAYAQGGSHATNLEMFSPTRSSAPPPPSKVVTSPSSSTASQGFTPWREDIEKGENGIVVTTSVGISVEQTGVGSDGKTFFQP